MAKYSSPVPEWAWKLVREVAEQFGITTLPYVKWHEYEFMTSAGWAQSHELGNTVWIKQGTNPDDARMVLLHELAHWTLPAGESHGDRFWERAFSLYYQYGVPYSTVIREFSYKAGSKKAFNKSNYVIKDGRDKAMKRLRRPKDCFCPCHWLAKVPA